MAVRADARRSTTSAAAAASHQVQALIVQNGNEYDEGLREFWDPIKKYWADTRPENRTALHFLVDAKSTQWQYENGVTDLTLLDVTTWILDQVGLDRAGSYRGTVERRYRMTGDMMLISVNVGFPRVVMSNGDPVSTGIFKEPVAGRVMLRTLNLDGDRQADLSVHGGPSKAVYVYPSEHYDYWKRELPEMTLPWGMFGENFTTTGLFESELNIGDKFHVGSAVVMVTEPRMPCYKLGLKFGRSDIIKRFLGSERTGFYFAVLQEGEVGVGDQIELIEGSKRSVRVSDITQLYTREKHNVGLLRRAIEVETLPESWKGYFQNRLQKLTNPSLD